MRKWETSIAALSAEKKSLLKQKPETQSSLNGGKYAPIRPANREQEKLSYAQSRLWFLHKLEARSELYTMFSGYRLQGSLNLSALSNAFNTLVERQTSLRTLFKLDGDEPIQVIVSAAKLDLPLVDLMGEPPATLESTLERLLSAEANFAFNLEFGPLFRARLFRLGENDHILSIAMHHIISDGWSMAILVRELQEVYEAYCQGRRPELPSLPVTYMDYTAWEHRWLVGPHHTKQLNYWTKQLDGSPPLIELITDRPRPAVQRHKGATLSQQLPLATALALKRLSREEGVTIFMTLLAVFKLLLYRHTSQDDILIGSPIANRNRMEFEGVIGFFVNTLVLRTSLAGRPSFRELLKRVRDAALGAYEHQDLPFEKLVEALHPQRNLSQSPLFQIAFTYENLPQQSFSLSGLQVTPVSTTQHTAKFDLTLYLTDQEDGLQMSMEYNTDLFDEASIARLLHHYELLLGGILDDRNKCIDTLPLMSEAEKHQALVEWNDNRTDYLNEKTIHQLFERQARCYPDKIAITYEDQSLSYFELNNRANLVAHRLADFGVVANMRVGICIEPCADMIVGLLAILKAGCAYVPLDPAYPKARLDFMLEDTQVTIVLTQQSLQGQLPTGRVQVLCLDRDIQWNLAQNEIQASCTRSVGPESLAYVMYTSGSTGEPKGIAVPHRAVLRLISKTNFIDLCSLDRIAQVSNIAFDASTFEIWGALLNGASLVGIRKEFVLSTSKLTAALHNLKITTLFLTTALFNHHIHENTTAFRTLKNLLFGGEQVDPNSVKLATMTAPPERLIHVYGPTENTTFSTYYDVVEVEAQASTVPIGKPISNTSAYVLDRQMNPVPVGIPGELYLGGDGLARDYINRPELSAQQFIPNIFDEDAPTRLYRTGDMVRYRADGNIEFLGRCDRQVKIRGYRIELGEIESTLSRHPSVNDTVVITQESQTSEKQLVAYVTAKQGTDVAATQLNDYLKGVLPSYMIPGFYITLDQLPLTGNGKLDHAALPVPSNDCALAGAIIAPVNATEKQLQSIWRALLGIEQVSTDANFFDIGGHSLLAAHLSIKIERCFKKHLPVTAIFQAPTIKQQSSLLDGDASAPKYTTLAALQAHGSLKPLFWAFTSWDISKAQKFLDPDQPLYFLNHQSQDGAPTTHKNVEAFAHYYLREIRQVQPRGPYFLGGFSFGGILVYEIASQLRRSGEEVALLFLLDPTEPGLSPESNTAKHRGILKRLKMRNWQKESLKVWILRNVTKMITSKSARKFICNACTKHKRHIPVFLRAEYTDDIYRDAVRRYHPAPYKGHTLMITASSTLREPGNNWYVENIKDILVCDLQGDHDDFVKKPLSEIWIQKLKEELEQSQSGRIGEP